MRYYYTISFHGNRSNILPQFWFGAISIFFVAIKATYCHKLYQCCNMVTILRWLHRVAYGSHFVAIKTSYCNKLNLYGNIQTYIATIRVCGASHRHCCKKMVSYCNKICIGCNMTTYCLRFIMLQ